VKILVVGGGVIGCATAYELAKAGCAVTLLERSTPGGEASGAAAGVLSPLGDGTRTAYDRLRVASWRLFAGVARELRAASGVDVELVTRGTIHPLHSVEDVRDAADRAAWAVARGLAVEAWDAAELRTREPGLATTIRGAMFVKSEHWVNNQRLVVAYTQAAVAAGVALMSGCAVSRVLVEDGHARGVLADGERFEADAVLLAAGAWTSALVASFGGRLPVEPRRGQMVALGHVPPVITHCIHSDDTYLVPRPSGELLIGATVERVGFQRSDRARARAGATARHAHVVRLPAVGTRQPAHPGPVARGREPVDRHRPLPQWYPARADHGAPDDRVDRRRPAVDGARRVPSRTIPREVTSWTRTS
jgi:glycine oxidase